MATHKVGGEVDAFCTRCKMTLAHTILAMLGTKVARVRCNTCGGDHAYRSAPGARSTSSTPRAPAKPKSQRVVIGWEQRLEGRDLAAAKKYSPRETFAVDELVDHMTFGIGLVTAVRHDKVDIAFKADQKTLVHGRGESPAAKPVFQPPRGKSASPADKQPSPEAESAPAEAEPESDEAAEA